jgi:hypothetical protein
MESTDSTNEVKAWLISMIGKMIDVMILQKLGNEMLEQVVWKGRGKVVRCVQEGVVLELNAGGASWWSRFWGSWGVKHVVSRWIQQPLSVPYHDLRIDLDPMTRTKWLVIDGATWKRSPEELAEGKAEGRPS